MVPRWKGWAARSPCSRIRRRHAHVSSGHELQYRVKPDCADPVIRQALPQDCRQPHEMADVPQVLLTHLTLSEPPALTTQTSPAGQVQPVAPEQMTVAQAEVVIAQWE